MILAWSIFGQHGPLAELGDLSRCNAFIIGNDSVSGFF